MNEYLEQIMNDIEDYFRLDDIREELEGCTDLDDAQTAIYEYLWTCDAVTGNMSGSYFCNSYKAKEMVFANMETVTEALKEFCCGQTEEVADAFLNERWEYLDVTARCYMLGEAVDGYVANHEEEISKYINLA